MISKAKCITLAGFLIFGSSLGVSQALACSKSHGKSAKDREVAARICKVFEETPHILMMSVQESILYVDVTRTFFDQMAADKLSGTKLVKIWMRAIRSESGSEAVTVWVYVDKEKVIEGQTSWSGEDKVVFLF